MNELTDEELQALLSDQLAKQEGEEIIAELEHENLLLKVAVAELRDRIDILKGKNDTDLKYYCIQNEMLRTCLYNIKSYTKDEFILARINEVLARKNDFKMRDK